MSSRSAKLFVNGGSQAVRLPVEFRFEEAQEVYVRRDEVTGDVILSAKPLDSWDDFFALREALTRDDKEFLAKRPLNEPLRPRKSLASR